jgi:hypothetical protein
MRSPRWLSLRPLPCASAGSLVWMWTVRVPPFGVEVTRSIDAGPIRRAFSSVRCDVLEEPASVLRRVGSVGCSIEGPIAMLFIPSVCRSRIVFRSLGGCVSVQNRISVEVGGHARGVECAGRTAEQQRHRDQEESKIHACPHGLGACETRWGPDHDVDRCCLENFPNGHGCCRHEVSCELMQAGCRSHFLTDSGVCVGGAIETIRDDPGRLAEGRSLPRIFCRRMSMDGGKSARRKAVNQASFWRAGRMG